MAKALCEPERHHPATQQPPGDGWQTGKLRLQEGTKVPLGTVWDGAPPPWCPRTHGGVPEPLKLVRSPGCAVLVARGRSWLQAPTGSLFPMLLKSW